MGRVLTNEEIQELMAPKSKVKDKPPLKRFPAPPQHGPLRYYEVPSLCVVAGYWSYPENNEEKVWVKSKSGGCRTQTYYKVDGIPMCCTHALRTLNDMLIEENYDVKEYIMTPDETAQAEITALKESESRLIKVNDQLLRKLEADAA